jgi:hypothetical protein
MEWAMRAPNLGGSRGVHGYAFAQSAASERKIERRDDHNASAHAQDAAERPCGDGNSKEGEMRAGVDVRDHHGLRRSSLPAGNSPPLLVIVRLWQG